jgi:hypothetical protein
LNLKTRFLADILYLRTLSTERFQRKIFNLESRDLLAPCIDVREPVFTKVLSRET